MLFILAGLLGETSSEPISELVSKLILEPVFKPVLGELGRSYFKFDSAMLPPICFRSYPPFNRSAPGPNPSSRHSPFSCMSNISFRARPISYSSSYASFSTKELVSSNSICTLSSSHKVLLLNTLYALLCEKYPTNIASSLLDETFPRHPSYYYAHNIYNQTLSNA